MTRHLSLRRSLLIVLAVLILPVALEGSAHAVTGWVSGTWQFWNKNGNYCPQGNNCTGARYVQLDYDRRLPVSNGSVWVTDTTGALLGYGSTDTSGNYKVSWTRTTFPAQIRVHIFPYEKNTRIYFTNTAGQLINNATAYFNTAANTTSASPQAIGTFWVGSSAAPEPYYNAYWAGERQWRQVMAFSSVLYSNFTAVEVRGFANTIPGYMPTPTGTCNSSCAWGPTKKVQMNSGSGLQPQGRIMHELGHIATYVTKPWQLTTDYTWAPAGQPPGSPTIWNFTSGEYGVVTFEEGFATHYGNVTFWADNSTTPTTCLSTSHCYNDVRTAPAANTDVEASSNVGTNNCSTAAAAPEQRWALSAIRFFWDVYDNRVDGNDTYSANQSGHLASHLHNLSFYPTGTGANQHDEPWNSDYSAVTEKDGRGSYSYAVNYAANVRSVYSLRTMNCNPL